MNTRTALDPFPTIRTLSQLAVGAGRIALNMMIAGLNRLDDGLYQCHCRLTPLYDILSAFPAVSKQSLHEKDLKLAMSLKGGRSGKYECRMIRREHFLATAKDVGFNQDSMDEILDDMAAQTEHVSETLPDSFPHFIAEPIFDGMRRYSHRLLHA